MEDKVLKIPYDLQVHPLGDNGEIDILPVSKEKLLSSSVSMKCLTYRLRGQFSHFKASLNCCCRVAKYQIALIKGSLHTIHVLPSKNAIKLKNV